MANHLDQGISSGTVIPPGSSGPEVHWYWRRYRSRLPIHLARKLAPRHLITSTHILRRQPVCLQATTYPHPLPALLQRQFTHLIEKRFLALAIPDAHPRLDAHSSDTWDAPGQVGHIQAVDFNLDSTGRAQPILGDELKIGWFPETSRSFALPAVSLTPHMMDRRCLAPRQLLRDELLHGPVAAQIKVIDVHQALI